METVLVSVLVIGFLGVRMALDLRSDRFVFGRRLGNRIWGIWFAVFIGFFVVIGIAASGNPANSGTVLLLAKSIGAGIAVAMGVYAVYRWTQLGQAARSASKDAAAENTSDGGLLGDIQMSRAGYDRRAVIQDRFVGYWPRQMALLAVMGFITLLVLLITGKM